MITATCSNTQCRWKDVARNILGEPDPVLCGKCGETCETTDRRDDPPDSFDA